MKRADEIVLDLSPDGIGWNRLEDGLDVRGDRAVYLNNYFAIRSSVKSKTNLITLSPTATVLKRSEMPYNIHFYTTFLGTGFQCISLLLYPSWSTHFLHFLLQTTCVVSHHRAWLA